MTEQRERRLIAEYAIEKLTGYRYVFGHPLGPVAGSLEAEVGLARAIKLSKPFRPEVDLLCYFGTSLLLIEAKIFRIVDGAAKLSVYKALVPTTPELAPYLDRPVRMRLVVPWNSVQTQAIADSQGIEVDIFRPSWVDQYVEQYQQYWTAEARTARAEKQRIRTLLGVE